MTGNADHQLRTVCAAGQPSCTQVSQCIGLPRSDREFPRLTGRSATQRARGGHAHGSGGGRPHLSNLRILPAWTRSLMSPAVKTIPRIFRIMETSVVTTRTLQGMARVRSGQAPAWPLSFDRSVRRLQGQVRLRVYVDRYLSACAGCPAEQSRLRLEGRTRTLSGPSPDLTSSVSSGLLCELVHIRHARSHPPRPCPRVVAIPGSEPSQDSSCRLRPTPSSSATRSHKNDPALVTCPKRSSKISSISDVCLSLLEGGLSAETQSANLSQPSSRELVALSSF